MTFANRRAKPPPHMRRDLVRRLEAKAANTCIRELHQLVRPPFGERLGCFAIAEIGMRRAFLVRRVTRIEPGFSRFERIEPVTVVLE